MVLPGTLHCPRQPLGSVPRRLQHDSREAVRRPYFPTQDSRGAVLTKAQRFAAAVAASGQSYNLIICGGNAPDMAAPIVRGPPLRHTLLCAATVRMAADCPSATALSEAASIYVLYSTACMPFQMW